MNGAKYVAMLHQVDTPEKQCGSSGRLLNIQDTLAVLVIDRGKVDHFNGLYLRYIAFNSGLDTSFESHR